MKLAISSVVFMFAICCCGKSNLADEVVLREGEAYYHFKISKIHDGSGDFDLIPYMSGLAGERKSIKKRRSFVDDQIEIMYIVNDSKSRTSDELRIASRNSLDRIDKNIDFDLDIRTWNNK